MTRYTKCATQLLLGRPVHFGSGKDEKAASGRLFHVRSGRVVGPAARICTLKTIVYIDGYNLYYGRIRGTPYKWLDVVALCGRLLKEQDPTSALSTVRYFSAPALPRFATHGELSGIAQSAYHRALQALHPSVFDLTLGEHTWAKKGVEMPEFVAGQPFDRDRKVRVWRVEEKKTDVNLALAMYRDAAKGLVDHLVLVSNDRDAEPALMAIREDYPGVRIGVISPVRLEAGRHALGRQPYRPTSQSLARHADWTRSHIRDDELAAALLPDQVAPAGRKIIRKPAHW